MKHDEILGMARKADCGHESMTLDWIAPKGLSAFAKLVEQATLERAAKVCEEISDEYARTESRRYPELKTDAETGASDCESAIRALKDSND